MLTYKDLFCSLFTFSAAYNVSENAIKLEMLKKKKWLDVIVESRRTEREHLRGFSSSLFNSTSLVHKAESPASQQSSYSSLLL